MSNEPTVALQMIVKDEVKEVNELVSQAVPYFNEINLTVSDKKAAKELQQQWANQPEVTVIQRDWNHRFDEARNENLAMGTTDYWFWLDCDDKFDFRVIPQLVALAEANNFDQILLPYNYAQDEHGNCIAFHWRERLFRRSHPFTWKGWIHETPISHVPFKAHRVNAEVIHSPADDHVLDSLDRNHKILVEASSQSDDPRYQMYLGASHHARGEHGEALQVLDKFIKVSGSSEDIYRALIIMAECAHFLKRPQVAINYALQAAGLIPEYPQAYWSLALFEGDQEHWVEALEWVKVSESKPEPDTLGVYDPTSRDRARLIAAQSEAMLKNYNAGLKWLRTVSPTNETRQELEELYVNEADAEFFIKLLPKVRRYFASDEQMYNALCYDMKYDVRLRGLRESVTEPKVWDDKSIVILCGEGYEEWGPHTLDKGMGGSEEAVIYLSREMAKLGWHVTIYGAVEEKMIDGEGTEEAVHYLPWREFNRADQFNVFVAWRAPEFTEHVQAKIKIADIHDVLGKDRMKPYGDVTYFVKSNYHRNLYPELPDESFKVIGNGIVKGQFA